MSKPKPKALNTVLDRANEAAVQHAATQAVIRKQQYAQSKELAIQLAKDKLETTTTEDDWTTTTELDQIRVAHILQIDPLVKVVNPVGTSDLLLWAGTDTIKWPTIRDLAHLGELVELHGLH